MFVTDQSHLRRYLTTPFWKNMAQSVLPPAATSPEAVHLRPCRALTPIGSGTVCPIRADIHTLLDSGLIAIEPVARTNRCVQSSARTQYEALSTRKLAD